MNLEYSMVTIGSEQVKTNGQIHTNAGYNSTNKTSGLQYPPQST